MTAVVLKVRPPSHYAPDSKQAKSPFLSPEKLEYPSGTTCASSNLMAPTTTCLAMSPCYFEVVELVARLTTLDKLGARSASRIFWLSRPRQERIAEVERLRREYVERLRGTRPHGVTEGLRGSLRIVERAHR